MAKSFSEGAVLRMRTTEVLVPTLVQKRDSGVLYGLHTGDFLLEDNGIPQEIHVQEEMDTAPVALVVAVEQGGASVLQFDRIAKLGPLLDSFLADPRSQVALVGFDSQPWLARDFTQSAEEISAALSRLQPGDGGAAILDTASYCVDLLSTQPKEYRRVLLLISEERDHGSQYAKSEDVIRKIGASDALVLSITFSPIRAELIHDLKDSGENRTTNIVSALMMLVQAFRKNVAKELATMSGGEYSAFSSDKNFQQKILAAATHARNRYLITFRPSAPTPGLHSLKVRTKDDYGARIVARANYWVDEEP